MQTCLSVCLPVCLSVCLSVFLYVCLSVCLHVAHKPHTPTGFAAHNEPITRIAARYITTEDQSRRLLSHLTPSAGTGRSPENNAAVILVGQANCRETKEEDTPVVFAWGLWAIQG